MAKTINLHGHNYRVINPKTERAQRIFKAWLNSWCSTLREAYDRYSDKKADAYEYCLEREREFSSTDGYITGHSTCAFSYAFSGYCEGKKYLIYITKDYDYAIDYNALYVDE